MLSQPCRLIAGRCIVMEIRTYSKLVTIPTFEERYRYLRLRGRVGQDTFGFDRWINQKFYQQSPEWRSIRNKVILRDNGCDLGIIGREIFEKVVVHHMNPIRKEDLDNITDFLLNPEFLISTTPETHNAIHYGDENLLVKDPIERRPYDTCPWKRGSDNGMVNVNRRNIFYRNRHAIQTIARANQIGLREASELWAVNHSLSTSPQKYEWFGTLDCCSEKKLLTKLFEDKEE